jgi:uncharacterized protein (DUF1684 family)
MSEYLELYDYRCHVITMYSVRNESLMSGANPVSAWERFRAVKDDLFAHHPQSPFDEEQRQSFQHLPYFPYNPALRFIVDIDTNIESKQQKILMNAAETMNMTTMGMVHFIVGEEPVSLSIYWLEIYGGGLFLPFWDLTCTKESYGGGRYLFDTIKGSNFVPVPGTTDPGRIMLDFNYAYNPSCAYNYRWVCPLAPVENRLSVSIRAGEVKQQQILESAA